jgi:hypothetical protein
MSEDVKSFSHHLFRFLAVLLSLKVLIPSPLHPHLKNNLNTNRQSDAKCPSTSLLSSTNNNTQLECKKNKIKYKNPHGALRKWFIISIVTQFIINFSVFFSSLLLKH